MLQVGLTGGIGAGKSTVSNRLVELGAVLVDSDIIARHVVEPGSPGLAEVVAAFGPEVLSADGALDRPALAKLVFADPDALARLNGIVHPLVRLGSAEIVAAAAPDVIVVHDIPLLVENDLGPDHHLVLVVGAPVEERVARLVAQRGLAEADARARVANQVDDERRRAVADLWLDNGGSRETAIAAVDEVWQDRLLPYDANLRAGRWSPRGGPRMTPPDPSWPMQAGRLIARLQRVAGDAAVAVDHVGSTAVPGLAAKDVIDLQLTVTSLAETEDLVAVLAAAGFPLVSGVDGDRPKPTDPDPDHWRKRLHAGADPGRAVNLHVRELGSPGWRYALLFRDWLRADAAARDEYGRHKAELAERYAADADASNYAEAKEPWFDAALERAEAWAAATSWSP